MERNSFVFYRSFFEAIKELEDKDKGKISYAIMQYGLTGELPNLTGYLKSMFLLIKPQIDANNERYENGYKGAEYGKLGKEYGKLGGRPKSKKSVDKERKNETEGKLEPPINPPTSPHINPNNPPNEDVDVDVNEDVNVNEDVDVKGKGDCKGKNQNGETDISFAEKHGTADNTETTRTENDSGSGTAMPEVSSRPPVLPSPEIIMSTSVETYKARVEYAKSLGIEESVAKRIANLAQSEKIGLSEAHYRGFVGKSGKEVEEGFKLLKFLAQRNKKQNGLKRINSS